jgi:hypothetical protein
MTTDHTTHAAITGPAVSFDTTTLRSWLAEPTGDDSTRADELGIDEFFSRAHGYLLSGLHDLLAALADDDEQSVWRLQPGIEHVGFFRTFDGETDDGALIVVDVAGGLRLASLHQDHRDFASLDSHGTDAAIEALTNLAAEANRIVARYQTTTAAKRHIGQRHPADSQFAEGRPDDGRLTDREVCIYDLTETQYRELEAAMGLPRYPLGRYKQWSAPDGVHLGSSYDLDAAIGYARRAGLRYSETREVYHAITDQGYRDDADTVPITCPSGHRFTWRGDATLHTDAQQQVHRGRFAEPPTAPPAPSPHGQVVTCPSCGARCRLDLPDVSRLPDPEQEADIEVAWEITEVFRDRFATADLRAALDDEHDEGSGGGGDHDGDPTGHTPDGSDDGFDMDALLGSTDGDLDSLLADREHPDISTAVTERRVIEVRRIRPPASAAGSGGGGDA